MLIDDVTGRDGHSHEFQSWLTSSKFHSELSRVDLVENLRLLHMGHLQSVVVVMDVTSHDMVCTLDIKLLCRASDLDVNISRFWNIDVHEPVASSSFATAFSVVEAVHVLNCLILGLESSFRILGFVTIFVPNIDYEVTQTPIELDFDLTWTMDEYLVGLSFVEMVELVLFLSVVDLLSCHSFKHVDLVFEAFEIARVFEVPVFVCHNPSNNIIAKQQGLNISCRVSHVVLNEEIFDRSYTQAKFSNWQFTNIDMKCIFT